MNSEPIGIDMKLQYTPFEGGHDAGARRWVLGCVSMAVALISISAAAHAEDALLSAWPFDQVDPEARVVPDTVGGLDATVDGAINLGGTADGKALLVDLDRNPITMPYDPESPAMPREAMTVEVWLSIEKTVEWGSILSAVQESGGVQKGWILGFRQSNFSFGLSTTGADDGDGRITWVRARHSLEWGRWYHVAATYDGTTQRLYVNGERVAEAADQSGPILYPETTSYVFAGGSDGGWRGWLREAKVYGRALSDEELQEHYETRRGAFPEDLRVAVGPWVQRLDQDRMEVSWITESPCPSAIVFGDTFPLAGRVEDAEAVTEHRLIVADIAPESVYNYRIEYQNAAGETRLTRLYEYDSTFNYTAPVVAAKTFAYADDAEQARYSAIAERILADTGLYKGYVLIAGSGEGRLAYELAWRTELQVVCVDPDRARAQRVRRKLADAGVYGARVTVHTGPLGSLPYNQHFANLVTSEDFLSVGKLPGNPKELYRVLRPSGGVLWLESDAERAPAPEDFEEWLARTGTDAWELSSADGLLARHRRPALPGSGEWTHQYGNAANTANSKDELPGGEMRTMWFGEPGPRPMTDRGTHAPAPVSADGRLFVEGDRRLFGQDAYNGTILWTLEIPDLRRANVPRDSSNMVVNGDTLYIAVRDRCWSIDGQTGQILSTWPIADLVPAERAAKPLDWGYLATVGDQLFGSAVLQGGLFVGADGEWYDKTGDESEKVVSETLFSIDRESGEKTWEYQGGLIMNSTITVGDDRVFFVESRNPDAVTLESGRVGSELDQERYLVAIDRHSGERVWEQAFETTPGNFVSYLMYEAGKIIAVNSSKEWDVYAFDSTDGNVVWEQHYGWNRDHHGGAMQHPAIINGMLYAEPRMVDLASGEVVRDDVPERSGCGTVSAAANALFFRDSFHAMWDLETDKRTRWKDFRPGCWLGIIPANGMMLAPETSAGCWCASTPMQTSIAFAQTTTAGAIN